MPEALFANVQPGASLVRNSRLDAFSFHHSGPQDFPSSNVSPLEEMEKQ